MEEPLIDPEILRYYSQEWDEDTRIRSGLHEIELIRTKEIIRRFLPDGRLDIVDVGGGSGVHAEWLLEDGHSVHLVEPVPTHVEQSLRRLRHIDGFTAEVGVSQRLNLADASYDAVLLLGPLYHLADQVERLRTWAEAKRVTKVGGLVFAVGISRFADLSAGLSRGLIFDKDFASMASRTLADGQHRDPEGRGFFTTAFYHHPDELRVEAAEAGWEIRAVLGVEGFTGLMPQLEEHWGDPEHRSIIVDAARAIEAEPTLLGLGPHIMLVGERTDQITSSWL